MKNRRHRPLIFAVVALVAVWAATWTAFHLAGKNKMTAEKIRQFTLSMDLGQTFSGGPGPGHPRFGGPGERPGVCGAAQMAAQRRGGKKVRRDEGGRGGGNQRGGQLFSP